MDQTSKDKLDLTRLRARLAEKPRTKAGQVRQAWPDIKALFDAGHDSGLAGQITARAEADGTYYTQRLGLGFDEITAGNLLLVAEAKRLGIDRDDILSSIAQHWDRLSPDPNQNQATPEDGGRRKK